MLVSGVGPGPWLSSTRWQLCSGSSGSSSGSSGRRGNDGCSSRSGSSSGSSSSTRSSSSSSSNSSSIAVVAVVGVILVVVVKVLVARPETRQMRFFEPGKTHLHVLLLPFLCSFPELAPDHGFRQE